MYRRLVLTPIFLFLDNKYKFEIFLNTISKNDVNKIASKANKSCKLIFEKNNNFGLIKAKKVSIHRAMQIIESEKINLNSFNLLNINNINNLYKHNIV